MARFYVDADVAPATVRVLRALGHNLITAFEEGSEDAGDEKHLIASSAQNRMPISRNRKDYRLLHRAW